jgi:large subunit ribosomal protein L25
METLSLALQYREDSGKGAARRLRASGMVPVVLYGREEDTISLSVNELELRRLLAAKWETAIVDLKIEGKVKKDCNAIIKNVQQHPGNGRILHVDFQYVHRGELIRLTVPVTVTGNPRGVKEMGGVLEHGVRELDVRCMPRHIPESIEIDVSGLSFHESIQLRDIRDRFPDVEFLDDEDSTLANVLPPKIEVEPKAEEGEEEAEEGAEPELIGKGKEDTEESAKEEK